MSGETGSAACRICGGSTETVGSVYGRYSHRAYELRRCATCAYAFIADPWTDFGRIYDERYYAGQGADPLVDYRFELDHPDQTIRRYEWQGVSRLVEGLIGGLGGVRWLDFGCGNGGLVRYLLGNTAASACGCDEGAIARAAADRGVPIVSAEALAGRKFDVVTAIEVLEHTLDPLAVLRWIRQLLRPGGLLFLTTGNAAPFAGRLTAWSYVVPEIHISLFEPATLELALRSSGFQPATIGRSPGFDQILKFKVLKNLKVRRRNLLTDLIPAGPLAAAADRRVALSQHPIGWAR